MATDNREQLLAMVKGTAETHDRMVALASGHGPDEDDVHFLCDNIGCTLEEVHEGDPAEMAEEWLRGDVLELYGRWEGPSRDDLNYKGCVVVTGIGGPHIELDTERGEWIGYWGSDRVNVYATRGVIDYWEETLGE
jgi:hypothetical protein